MAEFAAKHKCVTFLAVIALAVIALGDWKFTWDPDKAVCKA